MASELLAPVLPLRLPGYNTLDCHYLTFFPYLDASNHGTSQRYKAALASWV